MFIPHLVRIPKRQCGEYDITIAACKTRYTLTYNVSWPTAIESVLQKRRENELFDWTNEWANEWSYDHCMLFCIRLYDISYRRNALPIECISYVLTHYNRSVGVCVSVDFWKLNRLIYKKNFVNSTLTKTKITIILQRN